MDEDWDRAYQRQLERAPLFKEWLDALQLQPGERALDVGASTGYGSLLLAERVERVYAVELDEGALAYLERLQAERGVTNIDRIVADAGQLSGPEADAALVSMVLHHAGDPAGLLHNLARLARRALVAEFHPAGPGQYGPPRKRRLAPEQVEEWCRAAGWESMLYRRQSPGHYYWLVKR